MTRIRLRREWDAARARKFRQAAFVYLHVAVLYEATVWTLWRHGIFHEPRGPVELWLVLGGAVAALVFWALWRWQNEWIARAVWVLNVLRLPPLITAAFVREHGGLPQSFYLIALLVIIGNLWMLARAAWDV